jgi:transcription elongation regulator 1
LVFEDELKAKEDAASNTTTTTNGNLSTLKSINVGKDAAMEAEVKAARERQLVPLEKRMVQFRDLLSEKQISAFSTWEKELHKIVFDPRYLLLTAKERKQAFDKYVRERAEEERREKKNRMKECKDAFMALLEEAKLSARSSFGDFANR